MLLHRDFFLNRNFSVFLIVTFLDGIILYGCTTFIPQEVATVYTSDALGIALRVLAFNGSICVGGIICGIFINRIRAMRWPLVACLGALTLFCGLTAMSTPLNQAMFLGFIAMVGFFSAFNSIIPSSGTALSVPPALIGTSLMVLQSCRALGGTIGITIFTAVYSEKIATYLPAYVSPVAIEAGLSPSSLPAVFAALKSGNSALLTAVPGMTGQILGAVGAAFSEASSKSCEFVWLAIMAFSAFSAVAAFLVQDVPEKYNNFVESALEHNEVREEQQRVA